MIIIVLSETFCLSLLYSRFQKAMGGAPSWAETEVKKKRKKKGKEEYRQGNWDKEWRNVCGRSRNQM